MKFKARILSENEQSRVHTASLRILAEAGIRYHGEKSLKILAKNGAKVDWETKIVRLPQELVEQTLQMAPKSFTLGARNPAYDYPLPSSVSRFCIDGTAAFARDFESGERRYGMKKDIENSLRVFQQVDLGVMAWAPTCASDAPSQARALHEFFTMMKFSSKHGQHELHQVQQVPYLVAGLKAVMGSEIAIKERKCYSLIYCPVAPLTHDGQMLDAYLELGELDMPVMIMPMPVTGTTGPASLYSNICVANAEVLSSIVIYQLAHPGRPLIYSNATGSADFRTGGYLGGVPEMGLMSAALVEMGKFYGLPSSSAGCTSDAKQPGPEAVLEKIITTLPPVLAGSEIIVGLGEIEGDQLLILEQILVDNEIAHLCQRLFEGVDTSLEKDLVEDIIKVGPGGNFLTARSTRKAVRSQEFYVPGLIDRHSLDAWTELGKPSIYSIAREKVKAILEGPIIDPLSDSVIQELDNILAISEKEIKTSDTLLD